MRHIKSTLIVVVAAALATTAPAQLNPGKFHLLANYPVTARPADLSWAAQNESIPDYYFPIERTFDPYRIGGQTVPPSTKAGQLVSGWEYSQTQLASGVPIVGEDRWGPAQAHWVVMKMLNIRWFARYDPVANETPVAPEQATVLWAQSLSANHGPGYANGFDPAGGITSHHLGGLLGNPSAWATDGYGTGGDNRVYWIRPSLSWSGGVAQDGELGGAWILRATAYHGHINSAQHAFDLWAGRDATSIFQTLDDSVIYKVTWIDGRQVDIGFLRSDVDGDGEVGPADLAAIAAAFGTTSEDPGWNDFLDVDGDFEIGPGDFAEFALEFGQETVQVNYSHSKELGPW